VPPPNKHFSLSAKMNGTQIKEDNGESINNALYSMLKGTSRAEMMSNGEKIKPVALAIVRLRWSEGIKQLVS